MNQVDRVHLAGAPEQRAAGGQQADRARAEHGDGVSRPDTRQLGGVPSRHPRVSNQDEIVLMLVTGGTGQHHAVRIRERNPHPLARTTIEAADWPAFVRVTALTPSS